MVFEGLEEVAPNPSLARAATELGFGSTVERSMSLYKGAGKK